MAQYGKIRVNKVLTDKMVSFGNDTQDFLWNKLFRIVPVDEKSGTFFIMKKEHLLRDEALETKPGTAAPIVGMDFDEDTYLCKEYKVATVVPESDAKDSDIDLKEAASLTVTEKAWIKAERKFVTSFFGSSIWGKDLQGVAAGAVKGTSFIKHSDYVSSDPFGDIDAAKEAVKLGSGKKANVIGTSLTEFNYLRNHPDLLDRYKIMSGNDGVKSLTKEILAALFDVEEFVVGEAVYNANKEGSATQTLSYIVGNHLLVAHRPKIGAKKTAAAGYVFGWKGVYGGNNYLGIRNWYDEDIDSEKVEANVAIDAKVVAKDCGAILLDVC